MLIILDLSIIKTAEEVGKKLGNPVSFDPNKHSSQQQPQQEQQQQQYKPPASKVTPNTGATGIAFVEDSVRNLGIYIYVETRGSFLSDFVSYAIYSIVIHIFHLHVCS